MKKHLKLKGFENIAKSIIWAVRICLGIMFLMHCLPNIQQPYDFLGTVYEYELMGPKLGMYVAICLPWLELSLAICLLGGIWSGGALLGSVVLLGISDTVQFLIINRSLSTNITYFDFFGQDVSEKYTALIGITLLCLIALMGYLFFTLVNNKIQSANGYLPVKNP